MKVTMEKHFLKMMVVLLLSLGRVQALPLFGHVVSSMHATISISAQMIQQLSQHISAILLDVHQQITMVNVNEIAAQVVDQALNSSSVKLSEQQRFVFIQEVKDLLLNQLLGKQSTYIDFAKVLTKKICRNLNIKELAVGVRYEMDRDLAPSVYVGSESRSIVKQEIKRCPLIAKSQPFTEKYLTNFEDPLVEISLDPFSQDKGPRGSGGSGTPQVSINFGNRATFTAGNRTEAAETAFNVAKAIKIKRTLVKQAKAWVKNFKTWTIEKFKANTLKKYQYLRNGGVGSSWYQQGCVPGSRQRLEDHPDIQGKLLAQHGLYQFPEYIAYIKTLPLYDEYVLKLPEWIKSDALFGEEIKAYPGFFEKSFVDIAHELAQEVLAENSVQQSVESTVARVESARAVALAKTQELQKIHTTYAEYLDQYAVDVVLVGRIKNRMRVIEFLQEEGNDIRMTTQHAISVEAQSLLQKHNLDVKSFQTCNGNVLQQHIHQEFVDQLHQVALHGDVLPGLVECIDAGIAYNQAGFTTEATIVADYCWAVLEGFGLGLYRIADMAMHPINTVSGMLNGTATLAHQTCKLAYRLAYIGYGYEIDQVGATLECDKLLTEISDTQQAIKTYVHETPTTELIKQGVASATEIALTRKFLGAAGEVLKAAKPILKNCARAMPKMKVVVNPQLVAAGIGPVAGPTPASRLMHFMEKVGEKVRGTGNNLKVINKELVKIAKKLGFRKTNRYSQGRAVFTDGKRYITLDRTSHKKNSFWKMAKKVEDLLGKTTRGGTWDKFLKNRIGD